MVIAWHGKVVAGGLGSHHALGSARCEALPRTDGTGQHPPHPSTASFHLTCVLLGPGPGLGEGCASSSSDLGTPHTTHKPNTHIGCAQMRRRFASRSPVLFGVEALGEALSGGVGSSSGMQDGWSTRRAPGT